jgi:diguanylate cyclase (GGDEF)-like protein
MTRLAAALGLVLASVLALAAPAGPALRDFAVLEDPGGRETIESVVARPADFTPLRAGMLSAGYSRSAHWLRFTVDAPAGTWWLDVMPVYLEDLRLYAPVDGEPGAFTERRTGARLPFTSRELAVRGFVFRLDKTAATPAVHYLRLETGSTSILVPRIHAPETFPGAIAASYGFQLATLGALLVVVFLNAVSWYWQRNALTPWFLAFLLTLALNVASNADIPAQFLFPDAPRSVDRWKMLASLLSMTAGNRFYQRLFAIDARRPVLNRTYQAATLLPVLAMPFALAGLYPEAMRLLGPVVIAMTTLGLTIAVRQWRDRRPGAGLVLLSALITFTGLAGFLLVLVGAWANEHVLLYGLQLASLGSILALHFALGTRSRALRDERVRLDHLAHHDPLTQLPNRTLFFDRLRQAIARARRQGTAFAVLLVDLDRFKPVNDAWGHPVGDLVLQEVARRLQDNVRASDTVGRIGGDEFVALLPDIEGPDAAVAVARKIREAMARPIEAQGHVATIDCSIGIALHPRHGDDEISLVNHADRAMYAAKREGGGRVAVFRGSMSGPTGDTA